MNGTSRSQMNGTGPSKIGGTPQSVRLVFHASTRCFEDRAGEEELAPFAAGLLAKYPLRLERALCNSRRLGKKIGIFFLCSRRMEALFPRHAPWLPSGGSSHEPLES
jgi:hypothetical protein